MTASTLWTTLKSRFDRHARAQRLIDDQLDAHRGDQPLDPVDVRWLERHLDDCPDCRAFKASRETLFEKLDVLKGEKAPAGFAGRVLLAARARGRSEAPQEEERISQGFGRRFMPHLIGVGAMAALVVLFAVIVAQDPTGPSGASIGVSGSSGLSADLQPHFTVRAPGMGAAKVRSSVSTILDRHGIDAHEGASVLVAEVPRGKLIDLMKDLSRHGRYKVSKSDAGEIDPSTETIVIRFELE